MWRLRSLFSCSPRPAFGESGVAATTRCLGSTPSAAKILEWRPISLDYRRSSSSTESGQVVCDISVFNATRKRVSYLRRKSEQIRQIHSFRDRIKGGGSHL